jgi:hypothetical protein
MKSRQNPQKIPVFWDVTLHYWVKWFMLFRIKMTQFSKTPRVLTQHCMSHPKTPKSCTIPLQKLQNSQNPWAGIVQSVYQLATGWTVWGSNPGGDEIFYTHPDRSWGIPSLLYNGYRVFPRGKRPRCGIAHSPHLVPRLKKE